MMCYKMFRGPAFELNNTKFKNWKIKGNFCLLKINRILLK